MNSHTYYIFLRKLRLIHINLHLSLNIKKSLLNNSLKKYSEMEQ